EMHRTDFTVSVDAARSVTTGISAHDRATTIQAIANPKSAPDDLVQPGHVFPLRAKDGGVLRRAGHTEAAVDLARMAGLQPAGVIWRWSKARSTRANRRWSACTANVLPAMFSAHADVIVEINCTRRSAKSRKKATASWFTCGRKAAVSDSRQKFTLTNCRRKGSIQSRRTPGLVTQAICAITASARKSSSTSVSANSVF